MVKKIRFQESRSSTRRRTPPRTQWVFEPADGAIIATALAVILWLQWLTSLPT